MNRRDFMLCAAATAVVLPVAAKADPHIFWDCREAFGPYHYGFSYTKEEAWQAMYAAVGRREIDYARIVAPRNRD